MSASTEAVRLVWVKLTDPVHNEPGAWGFEASFKGLTLGASHNPEFGPRAYAGVLVPEFPDRFLGWDSVVCDGTFESGAARAFKLAQELLQDEEAMKALGLPIPA